MSRPIWFDDDEITPLPEHYHRPSETQASLQPVSQGRQIRVLLVEDNPADRALIQAMLYEVEGADFDLVPVERLALARHRLAAERFHVVLLDLGLPDSRGLDTFTKLSLMAPNVPFVVLTGTEDDELAARAVAAGAQDYLVKGAGSLTLVRSIRYAIGRHRAQRKLRRALSEATASTANLKHLIDQNLDGIVVLNQEGQILFSNAAAAAIFGASPNGLQGAASGLPLTPGHFELKWRRRDGRRIPIHLRLMPIQWQEAPANLALIRDLSEQREMELQRTRLEVARKMQQALLPAAPPRVTGFEFAGVSLAAAKVGGDYFDFLEITPSSLPSLSGKVDPEAMVTVIGDASGHGLDSAILIGEAAICIRTLLSVGLDVGQVLHTANRLLFRTTPEDSFVTVMPVRIDLQTRVLEYGGAGHPQGHVLDRFGNVKHVLRSENPPLALFPDEAFQGTQKVTLEPGDLVVLITDGIIEAYRPDRTTFGYQGVLNQVRPMLEHPAQEIAGAICRAARAFSGPLPQQDDKTAVVVKVL